jgi:hypothetical protein
MSKQDRRARLQARLYKRFEELARRLGKHQARAALATLLRQPEAACDEIVAEGNLKIGGAELRVLLERIRALLKRFKLRVPSPPAQNDPNANSSSPDPQVNAPVTSPDQKQTLRARYLICEPNNRIIPVPRRLIEAAWDYKPVWQIQSIIRDTDCGPDTGRALLRRTGGQELRSITVLLRPGDKLERFYLLRVLLNEEGWIIPESRRACAQAQLDVLRMKRTPAVEQMVGPKGWPADLLEQLAVVLDVPLAHVRANQGGFGGPLAAADAYNLDIEDAINIWNKPE